MGHRARTSDTKAARKTNRAPEKRGAASGGKGERLVMLGDLAIFEVQHGVREWDDSGIMRDEDDGGAPLVGGTPQHSHDLFAVVPIERGRRFVGEDERR